MENIEKRKLLIDKNKRKFWRVARKFFYLLLFFLIIIGFWNSRFKSLPTGISHKSIPYLVNESDLDFLYDLTYQNSKGERIIEQQIFDRIFKIIDEAQEYILIDMFLFNDYMGGISQEPFRDIYSELTQKLIQKKRQNEKIKIDLITDPINRVYGGAHLELFTKLEDFEINLIETNLVDLRDSNPIYSAPWRFFIQPFGRSSTGSWLTNPFDRDADKVGLRNWLELINFKANHRKVLVADNQGAMISLVTSANPHGGSSAHSNVALEVKGDFWREVYWSELAVAKMSGKDLSWNDEWRRSFKEGSVKTSKGEGKIKIGLITEGQIKKTLIEKVNQLEVDDQIWIAMFYMSDRKVADALIEASRRGVKLRLILDPNKDAFGYKKGGIPNRQVANKLIKKSNNAIEVRWYLTSGEQFHSKFILLQKKDSALAIMGSANLTRRNIDDFNLETNFWLEMTNESEIFSEMDHYFNRIWNNQDGNLYTGDYSKYGENVWWKNWAYHFQEFSGLSSF